MPDELLNMWEKEGEKVVQQVETLRDPAESIDPSVPMDQSQTKSVYSELAGLAICFH